ncbi:MAG: glycosyltransferase family 4 protein, partial [Actinobacteria bacterium]|nr:glycosyltransferase family 4 protein [Actinomycetota bacterium]
IEVETFVASGADPAEQEAAAPRLGSRLDLRRFDAIVVDALARIVCAPWLDGWRASRPVVAMVHELPSIAAGVAQEQEFEEPLLRADRLVVVSDHGRSILRSRGVPAERVRVVSPGLDHLLPPDAGAEHSAREDSLVRALCVAQWIPRKDILGLVRAWTARKRPGTTLELIGETDADPAYAASVRAAIADASDSSIHVSGPVDDATLEAAYAAADLLVLPSRYEGYGIVYAEALTHGLPIIACDVGPVPELVGEEAALLVPPDDVEALSGALDQLLGDPALRSRMSEAAYHRAEGLPRWEDTTAGFLRVLRETHVLRPARQLPYDLSEL